MNGQQSQSTNFPFLADKNRKYVKCLTMKNRLLTLANPYKDKLLSFNKVSNRFLPSPPKCRSTIFSNIAITWKYENFVVILMYNIVPKYINSKYKSILVLES